MLPWWAGVALAVLSYVLLNMLAAQPIAAALPDHRAATEGVECRKDKDVVGETPAAFKDIDAVMEAQRDLVDVSHTLKQVVRVKG